MIRKCHPERAIRRLEGSSLRFFGLFVTCLRMTVLALGITIGCLASNTSQVFAERDVVIRPASEIIKRSNQIKTTKPESIAKVTELKVEQQVLPPSTTIVYQEKIGHKSFFQSILDKMIARNK